MGRGVVAVGISLVFAGCISYASAGRIDPAVTAHLVGLRAGLGAARSAERGALVLHYDVDSFDGHWNDDVVIAADRFVERRQRADGSTGALTFGEDASGVFLRAGDGPWRAADSTWRSEARTRRALFAAEFLRPALGDDADVVAQYRDGYEYAFHAAGARTLTLDVSAATGLPTSYDYGDGFGRLVTCEDVQWTTVDGHPVPRAARCYTGMEEHGHPFRFTLGATSDGQTLPAFAAVAAWRSVSVPATATQTYRLVGTGRSAIVPVVVGSDSNAPERLVVDTGAWWTLIDQDVALRDGVVPTGEVPIYQTPPWLPRGEAWVGVADHLRVAGSDLVGVRVLVQEGLQRGSGLAGLIGANVLSQMVVDFDSPHHELRFIPEDVFHADAGAFRYGLAVHGGRLVTMPGGISGLGSGGLVLDTGADVTMVVFGAGTAAAYPRHRGSDARFGANDDAVSPDYWTTIDGARLGPFALPALHVAARDRDLDGVPADDDLALVGMGVIKLFRVVFDFHHQELYVWPGDAYFALARSGMEVADTHAGGASVTTVARLTPAHDARLVEGDRIVAIDDAPVATADDARRLLADHRGAGTRLRVVRNGYEVTLVLALEPRATDCTGPGDPFCPQDAFTSPPDVSGV